MSEPTESRNDSEYLTTAIGKLWTAGVEIDWSRYYEGERRRRVGLPAYPFERQRYWIEAGERMEEISGCRSKDEAKAMVEVTGKSASLHTRPILPNPYVAPVNDREKTIAAIWQVALGVDKVGVDDSFFELGGDSLIALQVISQLKEEFKLDIPVVSLYESITVRSLGALISSLKGEDGSADEAGAVPTGRSQRVLQRKQFQEAQRLRRGGGEPDQPRSK